MNQLLSRESFDFQCHFNFIRAVLPYELNEFDVHDVFNVFQVTGLNQNGQYFMWAPLGWFRRLLFNVKTLRLRESSSAKLGDYFEFFAEIDILCALSTCSGGDLSNWGWEKSDNNLSRCRSLGVEVYKIKDSTVLDNWKFPAPASYSGSHGMRHSSHHDSAWPISPSLVGQARIFRIFRVSLVP